jgi:PAS domain S-box-containing protein
MHNLDEVYENAARLRWRAEELARGKGLAPHENVEALSPRDMRQTLHELRVHQIELEMQNEELRRTQMELDSARRRYFDLYNLAPVGYCIVSNEGSILEANLTAVTMLGIARAVLITQPITRFILKDDQDIYYLHRKRFLETGEPYMCELRMVKSDGTAFWVRVTTTSGQNPATNSEEDREGAPVSRIVLSDISERKRVEEEKDRLEAQLLQAQKRHLPGPKTPRGRGGKAAARK